MSKSRQYWLVKQEPTSYAWSAFVKDGKAAWTGVRNFQARNNLRAMRKGDRALYYHSVVGKEVMGIAEVAVEAYPDPTAKEGDWSCVDLVPFKPLAKPVPLATIKETRCSKTSTSSGRDAFLSCRSRRRNSRRSRGQARPESSWEMNHEGREGTREGAISFSDRPPPPPR
ncbi:MAG: EVE domain-containing protein [Nibricoccus sp.]